MPKKIGEIQIFQGIVWAFNNKMQLMCVHKPVSAILIAKIVFVQVPRNILARDPKEDNDQR